MWIIDESRSHRIQMDVFQHPPMIACCGNVESRLPQRADANRSAHADFEASHHSGNCFGRWDVQKEMAVVGHDDESEQEERVQRLDPVEDVDGFPCERGIFEPWLSIECHCCDMHDGRVLDRVSLGHAAMLWKSELLSR